MARAAFGVDVGGTYVKLAAVTPFGRILREAQVPTQAGSGPSAFVERVTGLLEGWRGSMGLDLLGLGLGLAGVVDSRRGTLRFTPNLRGWDHFDYKRAFSRKLSVPVTVDNDANMATWGGYVMELKRRPQNVVGITLGTGVGGGIVVEGRLYRGATGSAGEIGHTRVEWPGEPCHCGLRGCLEAYAGSYGIVRTARKLLARSQGRSLLSSARDLDPAFIARAAQKGDPLAKEVWARTAQYLAVGLSNLILILNPEVLLLLGGVSRAGRWLMAPLRRHLKEQPFKTPFERLRLRAAGTNHWGCVGAALLALER